VRYEGRYLEIVECGEKAQVPRKTPRKDHTAGGNSHWMGSGRSGPNPKRETPWDSNFAEVDFGIRV
jgi:hypothetical protein